MSHDAQKADQITFHFYTKLFYILNDARATTAAEIASVKTDKWFNLETPDSDLWTKEGREPYRTISALRPLPPLEIQVLLTVPDSLTNNQVLVYISPDSTRVPIQSTYKYVLLERWVLELSSRDLYPSSSSDSESSSGSVSLSTLYKHGIPLFRSLYSLLRVLPSWKMSKRFRIRRHNGTGGLGVQVRVRDDPGSGLDESNVMRFNSPSALPTSAHMFPPIQHPMGTLNLTTTYLSSPNFRIDEMESLLSSRFMSMDTGGSKKIEFTPTLVKNQQRDSLLSSAGGSLGTRSRLTNLPGTSLPRSPPRDILRRPGSPPQPYAYSHSRTHSDTDSIAERFIIPSRTASNPSSPPSSSNNPPSVFTHYPILPITRATTTTSTSTQPLSGLAARLRKESISNRHIASDSYLPLTTTTGTSTQPFPSSSATSISGISGGTGTSAPTMSSPMALRRPGLNAVHPFKSNTLAGAGSTNSTSGSPRLTAGVPGSGLVSGAGAISSSPFGASSTGLTSLSSLSNLSNLPRRPSSPSSLNRPSPPSFAPSSIGAASISTGAGSLQTGTGGATVADTAIATPLSVGTGEIAVPPRKRYSSSFGHRYSSSPARGGAAVSVGSQGSHGGSGIAESAGGAGVVGSLGQASVRSGMSGMSGMSIRSGRSGGSGSAGGTGSGSVSGIGSGRGTGAPRDPHNLGQPVPSLYPDFHDPLDGQDVFAHDDHDDISSFMHDIDSRKPLIGRSRIYANANAEPSRISPPTSIEQVAKNEVEDDERQRTIRARPRDDSRERPTSGSNLASSPSKRETDLPQALSTSPRGVGSPLTSPHSNVVKTPPSSRRASYTGLSPPSSPLRNAIPLIAEDDDDQHRGPSTNLLDPFRPVPLSSAPISAARTSLNVMGAEGTPSSPPSHSSPMLTTASDVEARLKKMNDVFMASLEGLGGRSGKGRNDKGKEREGRGRDGTL